MFDIFCCSELLIIGGVNVKEQVDALQRGVILYSFYNSSQPISFLFGETVTCNMPLFKPQ